MSTRLPGSKYKNVFDRGCSLKGRLLSAWRLDDPAATGAAGVVASKKTFRLATDRNRAKRLLREAFRLLSKAGETPENTDWVFSARRTMEGKSCGETMEDMRWVFSRKPRPPR